MKRNIVNVAILLLVTAAIPLTVFIAQKQQDIRQRAQEVDPVAQLTEQLLQAKEDLARPEAQRGEIRTQQVQNIVAIAVERKELLLKEAEENPQAFLQHATLADQRESFSPEVQPFIEEEKQIEGSLNVLHIDNFLSKQGTYIYFLKTSEETFSLHFAQNAPSLLSGSIIRVNGIALDKDLVLESGEVSGKQYQLETITASAIRTTGKQNILAILVNFQSHSSTPYSIEQVRNTLFGSFVSVTAYYREVSSQKLFLDGDILGWYTVRDPIPVSFLSRGLNMGCDGERIFSDAIQAAENSVDFRNYQRIIVLFPFVEICQFGGIATLGDDTFPTGDGTITASRALINYDSLNLGAMVHELGHNLGLDHATGYNCRPDSINDTNCSQGADEEYADMFNVMGKSSILGYFNSPHKEYLGWLSSSEIEFVQSDGEYIIEAFESLDSGSTKKVLKIPREIAPDGNVYQWYYLEYRQPFGFDKGLGNPSIGAEGIFDGILIHYSPFPRPYYRSYLLDMHPATAIWEDAPLRIGETFIDPSTHASITPLSKTASGIRISVRLPTDRCSMHTPTTVIIPTSQIGRPGELITYHAAITNNNSPTCGQNRFRIEWTPPRETTGWQANYTYSINIAAGQTTSIPVRITSSREAVNGSYTFSITAVSLPNISFTGSAHGNYEVSATTATPTPPPNTPIALCGGIDCQEGGDTACREAYGPESRCWFSGGGTGRCIKTPFGLPFGGVHDCSAPGDEGGGGGETTLPADIDRNGCIGIVDFTIWRVAFQTETVQQGTYPDINGDGNIDVLDVTQWLIAMREGTNLCQ